MRLKDNFSADVALLSANLIWGTTFVIVRDILDYWPPIAYLMFRMSLAAIILVALLAKSFKNVTSR
jgi:drug/metabolite transporter (DMT)-like permease